MNDLHLVLASEECEHFQCGAEWTVVSDGRWDHNPGSGDPQLALALDNLDCKCTFTMSVLRAARLLSWNEAKRLNATETRATQKALLREAVLPAEDNTLPHKKHWPPVGGIFKPYLLFQWQKASMQRRIFAALCLTPGLAVWTLMVMSSISRAPNIQSIGLDVDPPGKSRRIATNTCEKTSDRPVLATTIARGSAFKLGFSNAGVP